MPYENVMKSSLSKQSCEISNLFHWNKTESALRGRNGPPEGAVSEGVNSPLSAGGSAR